MYALRRSKQFVIALKDYQELIQRGLNYYLFENQAALCAWEMPDRNSELTLEASQRAIELNPNSDLAWANSAYFHYYLRNISEAYQRLRRLTEINPSYEFKNPYLYPFAHVIQQACISNMCDLDADLVRRILQQAKTEAQEKGHQEWYVIFNRALEQYAS